MADVRKLDRATRCLALVGMFLQRWALMEDALRGALGKALGLNKIQTAIVASNTQLRDKIHILRTAVEATFFDPASDKDRFKSVLQSIAEAAWKRNMIAHVLFFEPDKGDGVQFFVTKAKGKLDIPETIWDIAKFETEYLEIDHFTDELRLLEERLEYSTKLLSSLTYLSSAPTQGALTQASLADLFHPLPKSRKSGKRRANRKKYDEIPPSSRR
ncbi:MAG TPA: hypothetical protein VGU20_23780 [Stellaceae bacterium]|nr:hypothetical protein [Stellaceae bacterium]